MIKAIIIDDIEQARITLKKDLQAYAPDVEVIGEAGGVVEGAKLLKSVKPDVLFLDIQMQDGSGFDLLDILKDIQFKIIFITSGRLRVDTGTWHPSVMSR
jgi:two-component system LytT family response regulator